jgi:hypothetical protein
MNAATQKILSFGALVVLAGAAANAATTAEIDEICPLDGTHFRATVDASGTSSGMRLDLMKLGAISQPSKLAECPTDHFVLYRPKFSADELAPLREAVASKEYKEAVASGQTTYFLLGKIYEHLKKSEHAIASIYLQASWQAESGSPKYQLYAGNSLTHFANYLRTAEKRDDEWQGAQLLTGELERRLGKFADAEGHFKKLQGQPEFKDKVDAGIINYELQLIAAKDIEPHPVPK